MLRGRDKVRKRPLNGNFMAIWDKICCTLAALGGCTLNRESFACKFVRGDMQLPAKRRGTLNRGGRKCRWDCSLNSDLREGVSKLDLFHTGT